MFGYLTFIGIGHCCKTTLKKRNYVLHYGPVIKMLKFIQLLVDCSCFIERQSNNKPDTTKIRHYQEVSKFFKLGAVMKWLQARNKKKK